MARAYTLAHESEDARSNGLSLLLCYLTFKMSLVVRWLQEDAEVSRKSIYRHGMR